MRCARQISGVAVSSPVFAELSALLSQEVLVLDGGMGTMIQRYNLTEEDFRGYSSEFKDFERRRYAVDAAAASSRGAETATPPPPLTLKGNNDLLCLTQPHIIKAIHKGFLDAGADIIETDTFNAQAVSQSTMLLGLGYNHPMEALTDGEVALLDDVVHRINTEAVRIAREACDEHREARTVDAGDGATAAATASVQSVNERRRRRFVAGSMGSTSKASGLVPPPLPSPSPSPLPPSSSSNDEEQRLPMVPHACHRTVSFDALVRAYSVQARALLSAGVDLLMVESVYDTLNCKAALFAIHSVFEEMASSSALPSSSSSSAFQQQVPVIVSATVGMNGRIIGGQSLEAFLAIVEHYNGLMMMAMGASDGVPPTHSAIIAWGLNCSYGPAHMAPFIQGAADMMRTRARRKRRLAGNSTLLPSAIPHVVCYPNAGLLLDLNDGASYRTSDTDAAVMASYMKAFATPREGDGGRYAAAVSIVGGCCGAGPEHIKAISDAVKGIVPVGSSRKGGDADGGRYEAAGTPPPSPDCDAVTTLAGLDAFEFSHDAIRALVRGTRADMSEAPRQQPICCRPDVYRGHLLAGDYAAALSAVSRRVAAGDGVAIIEVNVDGCCGGSSSTSTGSGDDALGLGQRMMTYFVNMLASDPSVAKLPLMLTSESLEVIVAGLKCTQGRPLVNATILSPLSPEAASVLLPYAAVVALPSSVGALAVQMSDNIVLC